MTAACNPGEPRRSKNGVGSIRETERRRGEQNNYGRQMADDTVNLEKMQELERRLALSWPVRDWCDSHVVLAVSGGADSVAMLRAMVALKAASGGRGFLYVAHLNHGMRGVAAIEDEQWLGSLCDRCEIPLAIECIDVAAIASEQGDGWEAAARTARYEFLRKVAERMGGRFVATAHTADDQVETVLHRILRGTGIDGLAGIPAARPLSPSVTLVRPMLGIRRAELIEYLSAIGQAFRNDSTNQDSQWTRNRLRNELLPHLRERYNRQVDAALARLASQADDARQLVVDLAGDLATTCTSATSSSVRIDCGQLEFRPQILVREVFRIAWLEAGWPQQAMGFDEWQQLASLASRREPKSINLPGNIRARRVDQYVILERP